MGKAAKITRGGNKKRVNPGRAEAKQKALGAKSHTLSAKEAADFRTSLKKKSQAIAGELRQKASKAYQQQSVVRMAPRPSNKNAPQSSEAKGKAANEEEQ